MPSFGPGPRTRDPEHARIDVHPGHGTVGADTLGREPRHDSGAARDVEHALARPKRRDVDELGSKGGADGGDEVALNAELRGTTTILRNLPAGGEERAWREALITVVRGFDSHAPATSTMTTFGGTARP
jgi:hypothetical protein